MKAINALVAITVVCLASTSQAASILDGILINDAAHHITGGRITIDNEDIPYRVAKGYFVNNTVKKTLSNPKIENKKQFDKVFGGAAVMGKDGLPTPINFIRQYAVAVVVPATNQLVKLTPISLQKNAAGDLVFTYKKQVGAKQTYDSAAELIILVDKSVTGKIVMQEKN